MKNCRFDGISCSRKVNNNHIKYVENKELFIIIFVVSRDLVMSSCLHLQIMSQTIHSIRSFSHSFSHAPISHSFFFLCHFHVHKHTRTFSFYSSIRAVLYNRFKSDNKWILIWILFFHWNLMKVRVDLDYSQNSPQERRSKGFSFQKYKIYKRRFWTVIS